MERYIQIPDFNKSPSTEFVVRCCPDSVMFPAKGKRRVVARLLRSSVRAEMARFYPSVRPANDTAESSQKGQISGVSRWRIYSVNRAGCDLECVTHIRQRIPSASNMQALKKRIRTIDTTKRFL